MIDADDEETPLVPDDDSQNDVSSGLPFSFVLRSEDDEHLSTSARIVRFAAAASAAPVNSILPYPGGGDAEQLDHHSAHNAILPDEVRSSHAEMDRRTTKDSSSSLLSANNRSKWWNIVSNHVVMAVHRSPPPTPSEFPPQDETAVQRNNEDLRAAAVAAAASDYGAGISYHDDGAEQARVTAIASSFLMDYEASRPPTLSSHIISELSPIQIQLHTIRHSTAWTLLLYSALGALFWASCHEGEHGNLRMLALCTAFSVGVFALDIILSSQIKKTTIMTFSNAGSCQAEVKFGSYHEGGEETDDHVLGPNFGNGTGTDTRENIRTNTTLIIDSLSQERSNRFKDDENPARKSRSEQWEVPLTIALLALSMETVMTVLMRTSSNELVPPRAIWSSAFKPIALFYVSTKARNALEALRSVVFKTAKVLLMELFLILCFAAVACRIYSNYESFQTLPRAFLSLFELSTTVVNPSIWMPMYQDSRSAAFFFVPYVVTSVFYLHSLVLSVVFKTYINAVSHIRDRKGVDAEDNLRLAFLAMTSRNQQSSDGITDTVPTGRVRRVLQVLRPHYGSRKINALIAIVDPALEGRIKYDSFRAKLPRALTISLRTAQRSTDFSLLCEMFAATIAIANFLFVIIVSSPLDLLSRDSTIVRVGSFITVMATAELFMRLKLFRTIIGSTTRFNHIFDGLAAVAAITSFCGMYQYIHRNVDESEVMLIGRAIDMIRIMRFFDIFRDIVSRSGEVFPALSGPLVLLYTGIHVSTYLGIALWGDAIHVGSYGGAIEPLYDLNNFNSYSSGIVTMFQVLVVNDWHAIAQVFLLADRCSSCIIVYTFFISSNLFSVSILLNILTAFFVGAFVTDNESKTNNGGESLDAGSHPPVSLRTSTRGLKRVAVIPEDDEISDSSYLSDEDASQFQIYERQGFEKIMQTVAGGSDSDGEYAKQVCDVLEIFEGLTPGREKVGYLVCCQHSLNRFGNRRFESMLGGLLHAVVSEMHSEIMELGRSGTNNHLEGTIELVRQLPHVKDPTKILEISARLLRRKPPVSIFVSRITQPKKDNTMDTTPKL